MKTQHMISEMETRKRNIRTGCLFLGLVMAIACVVAFAIGYCLGEAAARRQGPGGSGAAVNGHGSA